MINRGPVGTNEDSGANMNIRTPLCRYRDQVPQELQLSKIVAAERRLRVHQIRSQVSALKRCLGGLKRKVTPTSISNFYSSLVKGVAARSDRLIVMNSRLRSEIRVAENAIQSYYTRGDLSGPNSRSDTHKLTQELADIQHAIENTRKTNRRKMRQLQKCRLPNAPSVVQVASPSRPVRCVSKPTMTTCESHYTAMCSPRLELMVYITQSVELRKLEKERVRLKRKVIHFM